MSIGTFNINSTTCSSINDCCSIHCEIRRIYCGIITFNINSTTKFLSGTFEECWIIDFSIVTCNIDSSTSISSCTEWMGCIEYWINNIGIVTWNINGSACFCRITLADIGIWNSSIYTFNIDYTTIKCITSIKWRLIDCNIISLDVNNTTFSTVSSAKSTVYNIWVITKSIKCSTTINISFTWNRSILFNITQIKWRVSDIYIITCSEYSPTCNFSISLTKIRFADSNIWTCKTDSTTIRRTCRTDTLVIITIDVI